MKGFFEELFIFVGSLIPDDILKILDIIKNKDLSEYIL